MTGPSGDQCVVNMRTKTCACRRWEVTGIPCRHVVASIWVKAAHDPSVGRPETFVNEVYTMERWRGVYNYKIYPINDVTMWPKSPVPTLITAPKYHKPIGRPKKSRKKSAVENEDGNKGKSGKKTKGKGVESAEKGKKGKKAKGKVGEDAEQGPSKKAKRPPGSNTCGGCHQKGHNIRSCTATPVEK